MRLLIDLQACQTEASRGRGVGRYTEALTGAIARHAGPGADLRVCLNGAFGDTLAPVTDSLSPWLHPGRFSTYRYPSLAPRLPGDRGTMTEVAEAIVRQHWASLRPDVLHVSHASEGFGGEAVVPARMPSVPGLVRSATIYDLIPLRFRSHYLVDPAFRRWYLRCLGAIRGCDHLLAISESTRQDALELLELDPDRVTTIWGGTDERFRPGEIDPRHEDAFRRHFGLGPRFVLYTGGDEYRKNLEGALAAFALLPPASRKGVQLVIVCGLSDGTRRALAATARRLGLREQDVVTTGHVCDDDLVTFYRLCDAFVFPSLYEGFGLPVLEAMNCGAPAIGGDNSSVREIIGRRDALFDAARPESIAQVLARVLGDRAFADELRRSGTERGRAFSWARSAGLAYEALSAAWERAKPRPASVCMLPPRRLAVFTPLPPCRSGIADYCAAFLPHLARYFDIEVYIDDHVVEEPYLEANFRVRTHHEFEARRERYDAVIYEMGNSEFHAYMLEHLAREPGIVVLHDAFLSGLNGYLDFHLGRSGHFTRSMIDAHGTRARRLLAPAFGVADPIGAAMVELPCTRQVLRQASGIISHSVFNLEVARDHYPEGWAAPYRIIPQLVRPAPLADATRRSAARLAVGLPTDAIVVCTFGHIAWNKCGDVLVAAFLRLRDPGVRVHLVFAGELAKDAFGRELEAAIRASGVRERVRITGYLTEDEYERYLEAADVAVQLRTHSRGGTPKGVLDCLARGVPVVVNEAASYCDYPDDVVAKIPARPAPGALAAALDALIADAGRRERLGDAGRRYVREAHSPERVAAQYALAIDAFLQGESLSSPGSALRDFGAILVDDPDGESMVPAVAAAYQAQRAWPSFERRRLLVDVSHLLIADHGTGVPRVVRNIVKWLYGSRRAGFEPVAVYLAHGRLLEANGWLAAQGLLAATEVTDGDRLIEPRWGDRLLMLDSSWARIDEFVPVYADVRRAGGKVVTVVYDLLPIQFPQHMVEGGADWFRGWLARAVAHSDALMCISRAVADDLAAEIERASLRSDRPVPIGYWHLGADFHPAAPGQAPSARVAEAMADAPLLMVGSIDPRKNHALVLDAFERLWTQGALASLCIAGKPGWLVDELMERIDRHPELGHRLHYILDPSDEELAFCYRRAAGLLFASAGEGFGLPLVEAARCGTPLLVCDIPVAREVAGPHATYFPLDGAEGLADAIMHWYEARGRGKLPDASEMPCYTWEQSAEALINVVLDEAWYRRAGGTSERVTA